MTIPNWSVQPVTILSAHNNRSMLFCHAWAQLFVILYEYFDKDTFPSLRLYIVYQSIHLKYGIY